MKKVLFLLSFLFCSSILFAEAPRKANVFVSDSVFTEGKKDFAVKKEPLNVQSIESFHKLLVSYLKFCELNGITYEETVNNTSITFEFLNWSKQIDASFINIHH